MTAIEARQMLASAQVLVPAEAVTAALARVAQDITARLAEHYPLVLSVMGGAVVFTGNLLPLLRFPLDFDYLHVTRYGDATSGGELHWIAAPRESIAGRTVLVLDDILDEGITLAAIRQRMLDNGAAACLTAVFADKEIGRPKPIAADFVGVRVPNRYVFGFGMDVSGAWRNLPAIYALNDA
jgi:hypoxanthine phosphoribosyltransferase